MIPDIKFKDYYEHFIDKANHNYNEHLKKYQEALDEKYNLYVDLKGKKDEIKESFGIDLDAYKIEWGEQRYNSEESLLRSSKNIFKETTNINKRIIIIQVIKYCHTLYAEKNYEKLIAIADKERQLTYFEYNDLVANYYYKVHEIILLGNAYRFSHGLGTFFLSQWNANKDHIILDCRETAKNKEYLIKNEQEIYNAETAKKCEIENIPYDVKDYRIFYYKKDFYKFKFIHTKLKGCSCLEYKKMKTIKLLKGLPYKEFADKFIKKDEDVYPLKVDLITKLNILLYRNPLIFLRYVRHNKYRNWLDYCRAYHRKD